MAEICWRTWRAQTTVFRGPTPETRLSPPGSFWRQGQCVGSQPQCLKGAATLSTRYSHSLAILRKSVTRHRHCDAGNVVAIRTKVLSIPWCWGLCAFAALFANTPIKAGPPKTIDRLSSLHPRPAWAGLSKPSAAAAISAPRDGHRPARHRRCGRSWGCGAPPGSRPAPVPTRPPPRRARCRVRRYNYPRPRGSARERRAMSISGAASSGSA